MASAAGESGANPAVELEEGEFLSSPLLSGYYASSKESEGYITGPEEGESSRAVAALLHSPLMRRQQLCGPCGPLVFGLASEKGLRGFFCAWADCSPMHFFAFFDGQGDPKVTSPLLM